MVAKIFTLLTCLLLAGCSFLPSVLYRIDVQQGNVVTEEMVEKLKPGMTKSQVLFVLGSPLIMDAFRDNPVSYTHLRAHETVLDLVCRLLLEKKKIT